MLHDPTGSCNSALDLMNRAVSGTLQPGMRENVAYFTSTERRCVHLTVVHLRTHINMHFFFIERLLKLLALHTG